MVVALVWSRTLASSIGELAGRYQRYHRTVAEAAAREGVIGIGEAPRGHGGEGARQPVRRRARAGAAPSLWRADRLSAHLRICSFLGPVRGWLSMGVHVGLFFACVWVCLCVAALMDPYNVPITVLLQVIPVRHHNRPPVPGLIGDFLALALSASKRVLSSSYSMCREVLFVHSGKATVLVAFAVGADSGDVMGFILGMLAVMYTLSGTVCCRRKAPPTEPEAAPVRALMEGGGKVVVACLAVARQSKYGQEGVEQSELSCVLEAGCAQCSTCACVYMCVRVWMLQADVADPAHVDLDVELGRRGSLGGEGAHAPLLSCAPPPHHHRSWLSNMYSRRCSPLVTGVWGGGGASSVFAWCGREA
jgi:hypothetical protein